MSNKVKDIAYDFFYHQMNMPGKLAYIKKVMESCNTKDQLDQVKAWGHNRLCEARSLVDKKFNHLDSIKFIHVFNYVHKRVNMMQNEITDLYNKKSLKV